MRTITRLGIGAAIMLLAANIATAADLYGSPADGYMFPGTESQIPWMAIVYFIVGLGGISAIAFKNSKRTHLD